MPSQYKANFDGAIYPDLPLAGIGVVIGDSCGTVIATLSQKIQSQLTQDSLKLKEKNLKGTFLHLNIT